MARSKPKSVHWIRTKEVTNPHGYYEPISCCWGKWYWVKHPESSENEDDVTCKMCLFDIERTSGFPVNVSELDDPTEYSLLSYEELVALRRSMRESAESQEEAISWRRRLALVKQQRDLAGLFRIALVAKRAARRDTHPELTDKPLREPWGALDTRALIYESLSTAEPMPVRTITQNERDQEGRNLSIIEPGSTTVSVILRNQGAVLGTNRGRTMKGWSDNDRSWKGDEVGHRHLKQKRKKSRPQFG